MKYTERIIFGSVEELFHADRQDEADSHFSQFAVLHKNV